MAIKRNAFSAFPARSFSEPVLRYSLLDRDLILANAPEAMRHVLAERTDLYRRVPAGDRVLGPLLGRGLASSEGDAWRRQRRMLAPAFTPRTLPSIAEHVARCAETTCSRLERQTGPVDLLSAMQQLSLDIAATTMFSLETERFGGELRRLLSLYATGIGRPRASDFLLPRGIPTLTDLRRSIFRRRWRRLINEIIDLRRSTAVRASPPDLFDMLSDAYAGQNDGLLVDEVSTMIFAGHETTGLTMFWACFLLAQSPYWQTAVRTEAEAVDLDPRRANEALSALRVTRAVVDEALRLYPPAYMSAREAVEAHDLCGVPVRRRSLVLLPFCMLHRNPKLWDAPMAFDPSRFLSEAKPDRFAFLPFGAGPRICIGAQLAVCEAVLVIARLLRSNQLSMERALPVVPIGSFSTRPSHNPVFRLTQRPRDVCF